MKEKRETFQKAVILRYLQKTTTHPTAETIYQEIKKKLPQLSRATVYRNLKRLKEEGQILELTFADRASRFDGNPHPHFHFHCQKCGSIVDLFTEEKQCALCLKNIAPGPIWDYRLELYGLCPKCQKEIKDKFNQGGKNG